MYLDYYSLKSHPFRITPDSSLFFSGDAHGRGVVLDALLYGINSGEGILKVVGEVGSGKTMLCRMLEERLPATVDIVYLANPNLSAQDILYAIAFELTLDIDQYTARLVVMRKLQDYLLRQHAKGCSVVVFIEEAQGMPLATLEEIRLLSNLETHHHKLLQIVMFGQPELDTKLEDRSIRQLRERITHSFYLKPLNTEQTREYLYFRMKASGCRRANVFSDKASKLIAKASSGLLRRMNIIADKSLLAAYVGSVNPNEVFNALTVDEPMVQVKHVKEALKEANFVRNKFAEWFVLSGMVLASVMVMVSALLLVQKNQMFPVIDQEPDYVNFSVKNASQMHVEDSVKSEVKVDLQQSNKKIIVALEEHAVTANQFNQQQIEAYQDGSAASLISSRQAPTSEWYASVRGKQEFTVQLYSGLYQDNEGLEKILGELEDADLLKRAFVCSSESVDTEKTYWSVLLDSFEAVSQTAEVIENLPQNIKRNVPYVRNIDGISCNNVRRPYYG